MSGTFACGVLVALAWHEGWPTWAWAVALTGAALHELLSLGGDE